jgi:hypothetical protein
MKPKPSPKPSIATVRGQPSWRFQSDKVSACLSVLGGHLGPVSFKLKSREVEPFALAPWAEEDGAERIIPILRVLRGDFFCMPFGGNATPWRGERHPVHGETANRRWRLESMGSTPERICLHASLSTRIRPGRVDKRIYLCPGQTVIYCQHTVSGMSGPMNLGHHAMLRFPEEPGSGRVSTSAFLHGSVLPTPFELPAERGYSSLKIGAEFNSLDAVPLADGGQADLSRYPARRGFEDLVIMASDPSLAFAWTAVVFPKQGYVWFALKDPRVLRQTMFWISNGGRHYPPWSGRHVGVMGLEELTSYFAYGLAEAVRPNLLTKKGFPTVVKLDPKRPFVVPYIMGVSAVPTGFDRVRELTSAADGQGIVLVSDSGKKAAAAVHLDFLAAGSRFLESSNLL